MQVAGGVDTHQDTHTAAVVDATGRALGERQFPATAAGYRQLLAWLRSFGVLLIVGVEGTGVYRAGLARHLSGEAVAMVEVDRPDRKARRFAGKSDPWTRGPPPGPHWPGSAPAFRRSATAEWRPCATCGWSGAARSTNARTASGGLSR